MKILLISFFLFFSNSAFSQEKFFLTDSVSVTPKVINISQNNNQCNYIENYIDILNCDLSAIVKQCTQDNGINPRKWQNINFFFLFLNFHLSVESVFMFTGVPIPCCEDMGNHTKYI